MSNTSFNVLVDTKGNYIRRLYSRGWDRNLAGWEEEIRDNFAEICQHFDDDAEQCEIVGEPKWMWMRFTPSRRVTISEAQLHADDEQVTMIRVHRKRGKRRRRDAV